MSRAERDAMLLRRADQFEAEARSGDLSDLDVQDRMGRAGLYRRQVAAGRELAAARMRADA